MAQPIIALAQEEIRARTCIGEYVDRGESVLVFCGQVRRVERIAQHVTVLIDTVEAEILFPNRLAYVRQYIINTNQDITPEELTERTGFPLGVSMVILFRLRNE